MNSVKKNCFFGSCHVVATNTTEELPRKLGHPIHHIQHEAYLLFDSRTDPQYTIECCRIAAIIILTFYVYYTFFLANKQAMDAYYYPPPSRATFQARKESKTVPTSNTAMHPQREPVEAGSSDNAQCKEPERDSLISPLSPLRDTKYDVDLQNDPSKHLLLSSLFNTLGNTEICSLFASKQKSSSSMQWTAVYPPNERRLYLMAYDDGGFTLHFMERLLSDIFKTTYSVLEMEQFRKMEQSPNIRASDRLIVVVRNPFDAISGHLQLNRVRESVSSSLMDNEEMKGISRRWCGEEVFDSLNIRKEARRWKNVMEYVLTEYLSVFGQDHVLMVKFEDLLSESQGDDDDEILNVMERYLKIANFVFDGNGQSINDHKFMWITQIICQMDSTERLLNELLNADKYAVDIGPDHCPIWNVVQNYATLYQYFPDSLDCL